MTGETIKQALINEGYADDIPRKKDDCANHYHDTVFAAYKEILTQYQRNDCDSEWEAYDYNESTDSKGAIDLTDALMKHSARQPKAANAAFQPAQHGAVLSSTQK